MPVLRLDTLALLMEIFMLRVELGNLARHVSHLLIDAAKGHCEPECAAFCRRHGD
jgi:hypothetical protein